MRARKKQDNKPNLTLDRFLRGIPTIKSNLVPKIKVPPSSGPIPTCFPLNPQLKYPTLPEIRSYQQDIVFQSVCYNTLVCLPTGLGKTHIAAILIANFARWFPAHKIFFLAPTRPLVSQQAKALGLLSDQFPENALGQVSGQMAPSKRAQFYKDRQILFATPQTIENDLKQERLSAQSIIMIIFDECHRAVGNSSYSQIIRLVRPAQNPMRIVGLSATPGSTQEKVQQVIQNLSISRIAYRDDTDPQVKRYLHERKVTQIEIGASDIIRQAAKVLDEFAVPAVGLLLKLKVVPQWNLKKGLAAANSYLLHQQYKNWSVYADSQTKALAYSAIVITSFLCNCRKALLDNGYDTFKRQFFPTFQQQEGQVKISPNFRKAVLQNQKYKRLKELFSDVKGNINHHPKLQRLKRVVQQFFKEGDGRVIVFTQLRASAKEIKDFLTGIPRVRCELFLGQSRTFIHESSLDEGEWSQSATSVLQLKQRDQIQLLERYRLGEINLLVSTSIGEQGLDIGEVDLIVCYDGGHSPIRMIQRRGRTGRKRDGKIYVLLMEGKQVSDYKKGIAQGLKMRDMLKKRAKTFQYYAYNSSLFEEHSQIPVTFYENHYKTIEKIEQNLQKKQKIKKKRKYKHTSSQTTNQQIQDLQQIQSFQSQYYKEDSIAQDTGENQQDLEKTDISGQETVISFYKTQQELFQAHSCPLFNHRDLKQQKTISSAGKKSLKIIRESQKQQDIQECNRQQDKNRKQIQYLNEQIKIQIINQNQQIRSRLSQNDQFPFDYDFFEAEEPLGNTTLDDSLGQEIFLQIINKVKQNKQTLDSKRISSQGVKLQVQQKITQVNQQNEYDRDDLAQQEYEKYLTNTKKREISLDKQRPEFGCQSDSEMSSEEILSILEKYRQKKKLPSLI